jgi:nucleotide-binding universal stress UspA family protein
MERVVVWLSDGTCPACVDAARGLPDAEVTLVHVLDEDVESTMHGAFRGLLGRTGPDPGDRVAAVAASAEEQLLVAAAERLGRPCETAVRRGHVPHEVLAACAEADLLVCARDGDRPGPHSLGKHTRFVVDHVTCAVLLVWP